jgi:carbamoyl-phosphate synthase large subunit
MREPCRVLVTGAGSGVGQGIIKALRISGLPLTVVAADIGPMNSGLYRADEALIIPPVERSDALLSIIDMLCRNRINIVMIGSEFDLEFFSINKDEIESRSGAIIVVASPSTVAIANDKWLTAEFLRENDLPFAESYIPKNESDAIRLAVDWGYPVMLKARRGTSSRHVYVVKDASNLKKLFSETPEPMLQRVIDIPSNDLGNEYTCSVFKTADGTAIGPFTARRTLRGGTSWCIEVAPFDFLYDPILAIANKLDFVGSLNIQLMYANGSAIPFELNSRFSGTTAIRAYFGFNEPAMAIYSFFYKEPITHQKIRTGITMRYHEEVFIENVTSNTLTPGKDKGIIPSWF